jgi:hypothetical protein
MAGMAIPVRSTTNTPAEHVLDHNNVASLLNQFDLAAPASGYIWVYHTSTNMWIPVTLASQLVLAANVVAILNSTGQRYIIYCDSVTGIWPNSGARTVPTGYTGQVIWDSQAYPGALKPAGMLDTDFWDDVIAA